MAATAVTVGDTIRLKASFYNWNGNLVDPEEITVSFFDSNKSRIGEEVPLNLTAAKESAGIYHYDYIVPSGHSRIYFEFKGEIDGKPSVERGELRPVWLEK
jgi:hypothetical protein